MQVVFTDGLGHEMFQYAMYLALKHRGFNPSINIGIISRNIVHNGFEICEDFEIDRNELNIVDGGKFWGGLTVFVTRHLRRCCCETEKNNQYFPGVFKTKKPIVYGYWQDERYFAGVEDEIRRAFTFRNIDRDNLAIGIKMSSINSVSIHIRRGDYLKYPNLQVCSPSYYRRAINYIQEHVESPFFYVFSDDLEWSDRFMKQLGVDYCLVDNNRGKNSYKDMYLMTCCHHNIIANSSFSWWGAWLGNQKGKIVVCPSEWIKGKYKDPCPPSWIRVNSHRPEPYNIKGFFSILCHEYAELKTGRKPLVLYAIKAYFCSDAIRLTVLMRRMQTTKSKFLSNKIKHKLIRNYAVEITRTSFIGKNVKFHHLPGIVIGQFAKVGDNCHIYQGVCLGQRNGFFPTIGNNVTLYPYSCVLGDVIVGDNSIIAAHAVVTHDVPPNCMVAGVPAKIVQHFDL